MIFASVWVMDVAVLALREVINRMPYWILAEESFFGRPPEDLGSVGMFFWRIEDIEPNETPVAE